MFLRISPPPLPSPLLLPLPAPARAKVCLEKEAPILELLDDAKIEMYGLKGETTAFDLTEEKDTKEAYVLANNYAFKDELAEYIK